MKVMVFGTFDILHPGHLNFLEQAKQYGDYLIIVVARDTTVQKIKGQAPFNNEKKRLKALKNINWADTVVLGSRGVDKYGIIRKFQPDGICLGYDQKFFIDKLRDEFPKIKIVRLKAYKPRRYKSSLLRKR